MEKKRYDESFHKQFNESIRSGDIIVIDANTLLNADGRMVTSRVYTYLFDDETQEYYRVKLSSYEYNQKYGKKVLEFFRRNR